MDWTDEPMTVGELRKKIKNLPADTPVYLVTDKTSPYAWDDERERWRYAHPLAYASRGYRAAWPLPCPEIFRTALAVTNLPNGSSIARSITTR